MLGDDGSEVLRNGVVKQWWLRAGRQQWVRRLLFYTIMAAVTYVSWALGNTLYQSAD